MASPGEIQSTGVQRIKIKRAMPDQTGLNQKKHLPSLQKVIKDKSSNRYLGLYRRNK
jgi:hypothetical protein